MSFDRTISCPVCGTEIASYRATIRKETGPLVIRCRKCQQFVDLRTHCVDWWLLTREERVLRVLSTAGVAFVTGFGYAMLATALLIVLAGFLGIIPYDKSIDPRNPFITALFGCLGAVLATWLFVYWLAYDKKRSSERLTNWEYTEDLISSGIATQSDIARAVAEGNRRAVAV